MNNVVRRMIKNRQRRRRDFRSGGDYEMSRRDYRLSDPIGTEPEYPHEMRDGKQGVKGTGPYGIGGRLYSRNRDYTSGEDYTYDRRMERRGEDFADYEMDGHHYEEEDIKLSKKDMMKWKRGLQNANGTHGEHFDMQQILKHAEQMGIRYDGYDEKDLCMTVNMLYSDFCEALKSLVPMDKELIVYLKLAQAWLEDADSPVEGGEKLALYYYCIVNDED